MIDKTSGDWPGVRRWLDAEIERLRKELEAPTCGIKDADHLRGQIMFARHIITTVEPQRLEFTPPTLVKGAGY